MSQQFICQRVKKKNGIREVHLTSDDDIASQPTEMLLNTASDMYREGDVWQVEMRLVRRATVN